MVGGGGHLRICGLYMDIRVTLTSRDTVTQEWGVEQLSMDYSGTSELLIPV